MDWGFIMRKWWGDLCKPNHYSFPIIVKVCGEFGCVREGEMELRSLELRMVSGSKRIGLKISYES